MDKIPQKVVDKYQDVYKQFWEIQMKKDRKANPKLDSISPNYKKRRASFHIVKDESSEKEPKALTKQATTISKHLQSICCCFGASGLKKYQQLYTLLRKQS